MADLLFKVFFIGYDVVLLVWFIWSIFKPIHDINKLGTYTSERGKRMSDNCETNNCEEYKFLKTDWKQCDKSDIQKLKGEKPKDIVFIDEFKGRKTDKNNNK